MRTDKILILIVLQFFMMVSLLIFAIESFRPYVIIILSIYTLISLIMFSERIRFLNSLKRMRIELSRVLEGNLKTRLFANQDHSVNEVIFMINELIAQLESIRIESIQSQEARKSLLSSISHDIRTPLTSITGYVEALKDDIAASEHERDKYLDIIVNKSNHLKQLIDEIFMMAKLDSDEIPMNFESVNIAELTREVLIEFLPEIKKYGCELAVNLPDKNCDIWADRLSVIRILTNLMSNALQHGLAGKVVGVSLTESAHHYQLEVWDKGPGIPKEHLDSVFERMFRSDASRNASNGGSGLGLAITKALTEKNEGQIWVESIPWKKTAFYLTLPKQIHN